MLLASAVIVLVLISLLAFCSIVVSDSAYTIRKKRFFCHFKNRPVEAEFIPGFAGLAGKRSGDVHACSAFENKYNVTCEKGCEGSEMIAKIAGVIQGPMIRYPNP